MTQRRRWTRRSILSLASRSLAAAPFVGLAPAGLAAARQPNVVLILTDDMRADDLGGMKQVGRRIVDAGTSFSRCFATTPLCGPSRSSILRGQYAHNHGVRGNTGEDAGFATFRDSGDEQSTIATWLQQHGYRTGLIGKYLNGYADHKDPTYVPPGWDSWAAAIDHDAYSEYNYQLNENGQIVGYGHSPSDYLTDVLAGKANDFIGTAAGGPFFLYLATYAPHSPSTPAPRHANDLGGAKAPRGPAFNEKDVSDKPKWVQSTPLMSGSQIDKVDQHARDRLRSLEAVDELVGGVLDVLEGGGLLDNTYVLFASDNGVFEGEHRQAHGKNAPYEEAIRLPLAIRGPGVAAGATSDGLVANIDFAPTIAALAGAAAPSFVDGRSLAPLFGGETPSSWRQSLVIEGFGGVGDDADSSGGEPVPPFAGLRTNDALYVEYDSGERELYNLAADPSELENLIKRADPSSVANFAGRLARLRKAGGKTSRSLEDAPYSLTLPEPKHGGRRDRGRPRRSGGNHAGGKRRAGKHARGQRVQTHAGRGRTRRSQDANASPPRRRPRLRRARHQ
ncbi:MAG TPA: sulfatase [Thermomicrobiales bacterium]|nr:sulfatase [Thermomicrobiales bacterium]